MALDKLIGELSSEGQFESTGCFTIGWEKAQAKLRTYQVGDPEAYLLSLVSAGSVYGARNVSIETSPQTVSLTMHDCYVPAQTIRDGFNSVAAGSFQHESFDLAVGLYGGLNAGFQRVELSIVHPHNESYRWELKADSEHASTSLPSQPKSLTRVTFLNQARSGSVRGPTLWERWFGSPREEAQLGGFVGLSRPAQLVDQRCELCPVPIMIDRNLVNRPLHLPRAPWAARIGELTQVRFNSRTVLNLQRDGWVGALVFQAGRVNVVVNGLSYSELDHPQVSGTVWAHLNRDLSRSRLLRDPVFEAFYNDLDSVAQELAQAESEAESEDMEDGDEGSAAQHASPLRSEIPPSTFPHRSRTATSPPRS